MDEHTYKEFIQNKSNGVSLVKGIEIGEYSVGRALTAGKDKRIDDIIKLCAAVNENKVLRGKIESIDVSVDGEIYMYAPPSLVIKFGGFDGMYERILKVSGAFEAGYDGNADGTIDFTTGGYDVFKPNSSKSDGES